MDDGGGWLIFALPPSEAGVHPTMGNAALDHGGHKMAPAALYLMCDNLSATIKALEAKGVNCTAPDKQAWGTSITVGLPSGGRIGLYQPTHQSPLGLGTMQNFGATQ